MLDLVGKEQETGKSLGTDLEQRKLTLPLIRLLQQAGSDRDRQLRQILLASENHKRDKLQPYLEASDALTYAARAAERYAAAACAELACLPPSEARDVLEELTTRVIHRTS